MSQEVVAFAIVGLAALAVGVAVFRGFVAQPLSKWLLKRGRVKLAMRLRFGKRKDCCGD